MHRNGKQHRFAPYNSGFSRVKCGYGTGQEKVGTFFAYYIVMKNVKALHSERKMQ